MSLVLLVLCNALWLVVVVYVTCLCGVLLYWHNAALLTYSLLDHVVATDVRTHDHDTVCFVCCLQFATIYYALCQHT